MTLSPIPWADLRPREDAAAVDVAMRRVLDRGWFVLGPEVETFETEFADATVSKADHRRGLGHRRADLDSARPGDRPG